MPVFTRSDWDATPTAPLGVRNLLAWLVLATGFLGSTVVAYYVVIVWPLTVWVWLAQR